MRLLADLRYAVRTLAKAPGFTSIAILSLALGIGANTAMFSYVDAVLLRPLPVPDSGRIVEVDATAPGTRLGRIAYPDYIEMRDRTKTLESVTGYDMFFAGIATDPKQVPKYSLDVIVSGNFFSGLGIPMAAGRAFRADEDTVTGRDLVAVISYQMWDREFARDPSAVGRKIRVNGADFTIVGVSAESFTGPQSFVLPDIYVPFHSFAQALPGQKADYLTTRSDRIVTILSKLKAGVGAQQAQAELKTIANDIARQYPDTNRERTVSVLSYVRARYENDPADGMLSLMLLAITGLVLLIACANVANLLLARGTARAKEMAIRMAIGGRRGVLVRQLLTESLLLALAGGLAGIGVGYAGVAFLSSIQLPSDFPLSFGTQMDTRLLIFSLLVSLATGVIFGLVPALRATRRDLASTIKASDSGPGRVSFLRGMFSGRNVLVTAQLALSVVLLMISGTCVREFQVARHLNTGFRMDHTLFLTINSKIERYDEAKGRDFFKKLHDRLSQIPGISDIAMSSMIPFNNGQESRNFMLDGAKQTAAEDSPSAWAYRVDEHYFPLMETHIVRGRAFDSRDTANSPKVAVINETMAKKLFGAADPIGQRVRLDKADGALVQVVGVAKTGLYLYWAETPQNAVWTPFSQEYNPQMFFEMRTQGDPASYAAAVREQVRALDPDMPILRISSLENYYDSRAMLGPRLIAQIVTTTGLMGLLMAVVGLYGVVAYAVNRRTREIGIRMAVGATPRGIVRMILNQGVILTLTGLAIGILLMIPIARTVLPNFVVGTSAFSAEMLLGVPAVLALSMLAACWIPARRAARIDPTTSLRAE
jgi:putative ABC transport system permease protein